MCIELLANGLETENMKMAKTIKISENAHRALEFAKTYKGIQIGKYASVAIIEAIQKEHPDAYNALKEHVLIVEKEKEKEKEEKEKNDEMKNK
ncbi:MAG: hypothetical protein JKY01_09025 [Pseudomonadales bacterium]|nr:hypothetical protein [Pseudomonadales bacterium]